MLGLSGEAKRPLVFRAIAALVGDNARLPKINAIIAWREVLINPISPAAGDGHLPCSHRTSRVQQPG
ncbi:MAG: hypothetical protein GXX96_22730 [Planctomycetaceae bacterium]|nr:hypothetical protein [Planctomycetaceae bacterium]